MSELPTDAVTFSDGPDDTIEWKIEMPLRFVVIDGKLVELRPADPEPPKVMGVRSPWTIQ